MISFCTTGTTSGDSSTPRSPRATITASAAATTSQRFSTASGVSILATTGVGRPACLQASRNASDVVRALHERQRDVVDADRQPVRQVAAVLLGERGEPHALRGERDAHAIAQRAALEDRARDPAARDLGHAQRDPPVVEAHEIAGLQIRRQARRIRWRSCRASRRRLPPASPSALRRSCAGKPRPVRIFGPCRSCSTAIGFPRARDSARKAAIRRACSSCVPCEKFSARDVHPRVDQGAYRLDVVGRRPQRTDNLGVAQAHVRWHLRELNGGFQCRA